MFPVMRRWAVMLGLLAACEDDPIGVVAVPDQQIDEFTQVQAAEVDILWVVDNSTSMTEEQALLADNFDRFIQSFTACLGTGVEGDQCDFERSTCTVSGQPCQPPDYHIGIVSTDPREEGRLVGVGVCSPGIGVPPANDRIRYCLSGPQACTTTDDPDFDAANDVCDDSNPLRFVEPTTPNPNGAFARMVDFGLAGGQAAREEGILTASLALGIGFRVEGGTVTATVVDAPPENAGFLREQAPLFVIFVSDEEDNSFGPVTAHYRRLEGLKGPGNELLVSASAIVGDPDVDGPNGELPEGCQLDAREGATSNSAGARYIELAMFSRGVSDDLQVCDQIRLTCGADQRCIRPVPGLPGLCVPTTCESAAACGALQCGDGRPCVTCEANACETEGARFLELLEVAGIYRSICSEDYGPVLDQLGFSAAGLSRRFALTRFPNCLETVPCCADGTDDCDDERPVCVTVDDVPIANDRATGWVYDVGSNAVFFDGDLVPPPGSEVQVRYDFTNLSRATGCASLIGG
jgi:hypothetical protein